MQASAVGIPWYRSVEDYEQVLAILLDSEGLPRTYDSWLAQAEQLEDGLKREGYRTIRAYVDPRDLAEWCRAAGLDVNTEGQREFAAAWAAGVIFKETGHT